MNLDSTTRVGNERMRPLVIDEQAKKIAARIRDYAEHPENVYRPDPRWTAPGDNPHHVCRLNTYRVVYSITEVPDGKFRHLSVSVPGEKYPNPAAVIMIADLFGFVGWDGQTIDQFPDGWLATMEEKARAVVVAQKLE